ncbi:MAG: UDP-N-acetylmuramate--L-alanine ligase [Anaerolineae bacterium]
MKVTSALFKRGTHVHLVGIGGAGLSAIARVLMEIGCRVSGSDRVASALTAALAEEGATVYVGHRAEQVSGADLLVVSSAIPADNAELRAARTRSIPVLKRADFLGQMMTGRVAVAIAGSHGKTTTSGMMATVLLAADQDPSFIVGGQIAHLGTNARAGTGPFVIEADEYDRTFLGLRPTIAVVTNVEHDHPDCYPTFDEFRAAFEAFVALLPEYGQLVVCADDPGARALGALAGAQGKSVMRYGLVEEADWQAMNAQPNGAGGCDYVALRRGELKGLVRLRIPGAHNVLNSLAVLAVSDLLGLPFDVVTQALRLFRGMGRRFEIKGVANGVTVVDDYAHHPTEIRATLAAARQNYPGRRIWAVWQPHTYSRVKTLLDDFVTAFADADHVVVTPIYAAREIDDLGVSSERVVARMDHADARAVADLDQAVALLEAQVRSGDVVLTLGAGDSHVIGERLLEMGKFANGQSEFGR